MAFLVLPSSDVHAKFPFRELFLSSFSFFKYYVYVSMYNPLGYVRLFRELLYIATSGKWGVITTGQSLGGEDKFSHPAHQPSPHYKHRRDAAEMSKTKLAQLARQKSRKHRKEKRGGPAFCVSEMDLYSLAPRHPTQPHPHSTDPPPKKIMGCMKVKAKGNLPSFICTRLLQGGGKQI